MSPLASWFKLNAAKPLAVLVLEARANGHTQAAIADALREYHLASEG